MDSFSRSPTGLGVAGAVMGQLSEKRRVRDARGKAGS